MVAFVLGLLLLGVGSVIWFLLQVGEIQFKLEQYIKRGELRGSAGAGCLALPAMLLSLSGVVSLFVHGSAWGVGGLLFGILWFQWVGGIVASRYMNPNMAKVESLRQEVRRKREDPQTAAEVNRPGHHSCPSCGAEDVMIFIVQPGDPLAPESAGADDALFVCASCTRVRRTTEAGEEGGLVAPGVLIEVAGEEAWPQASERERNARITAALVAANRLLDDSERDRLLSITLDLLNAAERILKTGK